MSRVGRSLNLSVTMVELGRDKSNTVVAAEVDVSVIVPVRNGASDLARLTAALERQTLSRDRFEVIIGDDGSTDGGPSRLAETHDRIIVSSGPPRNSYAARNRAAQMARGRVLAFLDSDCIPEEDWLEEGLAALRNADIVAGRVRFLAPERRTVWMLLDIDATKDHARQVRNGTAETANLFLRRSLYDSVGGFEDAIPEFGDFDFVQRCVAHGGRLVFCERAVVWHPARVSGRSFLRAQWIYSKGYGAREGRDGRVPVGIQPLSWIPVVRTFRSRRWWGKSIGPDKAWLAENEIAPSRVETLVSLPAMYLLVPYLRSFAQLTGWVEGRRLAAGSSNDRRTVSSLPRPLIRE